MVDAEAIEIIEGNSPLVLGLPHTGTYVPADISETLNHRGRALSDTDWHIHDLYDGLAPEATRVRTPVHRYVIDVNRDPSGASLYPGQNTTGLVPLTDFDGQPIWQPGAEPGAAETERRRIAWHAPYHAALAGQMERVRARHGFAVLYDCHSIRSRIPFLFDGVLPDLNIGTDRGRTCAPGIESGVAAIVRDSGHSHVMNGRFLGGWTTRHYGRPEDGWHAIQMELAQSTYMTEAPPWDWQPDQAAHIRTTLSRILDFLSEWSPS